MPATIRGVANYIKFPRARCRGSGPGAAQAPQQPRHARLDSLRSPTAT